MDKGAKNYEQESKNAYVPFDKKITPATTNPKSDKAGSGYGKVVTSIPRVRSTPSETALVEEEDANYSEWKILAPMADVRQLLALGSKVIANVRSGDIIEGHRDLFSLDNRVLCLRVRVPNHSTYPSALGWITLDASSINGKVCAERVNPPVPGPLQ